MSHQHALDLTRYHFCRPHLTTGITVYGSWYRDDSGKVQPALVLVPTMRKTSWQNVRPCVVPLSDAHLWAEETGDVGYFSNAASVFANALGKDGDNPMHVGQVLNVIHDEIGELMRIPPRPPGEIIIAADATMTDEDGKQTHREIIDHV